MKQQRFLITDINNPGASAKAQSTVPIMWDRMSTVAAHYNHVPGGSNLLWMDGHATFNRYPDSIMVNPPAAWLDGSIDPGT